MTASQEMHCRVMTWCRQANPQEDLRRQAVFAWAVVGLLLEKTVALPQMALVIGEGVQAKSAVLRLRRFLGNAHVDVDRYYAGLIRSALVEWSGRSMVLALDSTSMWGRITVVRLAVVYRGRAIPLAWQTFASGSVSVAFEQYAPVLERALERLPQTAEVTLLGDRGFASLALRQWCRSQGWHFCLRLKKDQIVVVPGQISRDVACFRLRRGQVRFLTGVHLSSVADAAVNLALAWPKTPEDDPWYLVTDLVPSVETFRLYGQRFQIEEAFKDDKSGGFQLEDSRLADSEAIHRLLLVMASAYLLAVSEGVGLLATDDRRSVDPHTHRRLSYFQLGCRAIRRRLFQQKTPFLWPRLSPEPDPEPLHRDPLHRLLRLPPTSPTPGLC